MPMKISRSKIAGFFPWLAGKRNFALRLGPAGISVFSRTNEDISFRDFSGPSRLHKFLWFTAISIPLRNGRNIDLVGVGREQAVSFVDQINHTWRKSSHELVYAVYDDLKTISCVVDWLKEPDSYPFASLLQPSFDQTTAIFDKIPKAFPESALGKELSRLVKRAGEFHDNAEQMRAAGIDTFIAAELKHMHRFFDEFETFPLTREQRLAVICSEDATLSA